MSASGQGAFGDRGCGFATVRAVLWFVARVIVIAAVVIVPWVGMACQQPAQQPPNTTRENVCGETSADCEGQ